MTGPPRRRSAGEPDRAGRPRRRWFLRRWFLLTVAGVALLGWVVLGSPLFEVTRVEVVGALGGREPAVRAASGVTTGDALARVWPARVADRVEDVPWVARASVRRVWPNTVRITVEPRVPVGDVVVPAPEGAPSRFVVVDRTGRVLWTTTQQPSAVPELIGATDVAGGRVVPRRLARAAGALAPAFAVRAATVAVDDGSLVVRVTDGPEVRFGPPVAVGTKSRVAAAVLDALGGARPAYLDVSVPTSPVSG